MKFSIWSAVSTAAQAEDDKESLSEQEKKCRAVGLAKGWVESAGPYTVPGESRSRYVNLRDAEEQIPALRAMLEDAKAGKFDILIMWDYNRLRDLLDPVAKTLGNYGVQLFSVNQPVEPLALAEFNPYASDSESMMRGMSQIISRWQISDLRRKYRFGVRARVEHGLHSLKIPYGYMKPPALVGEKKVVSIPDPARAQVVIEIKNLFLSGVSPNSIMEYLDERHPTPTGIPKWAKQTVVKILKNPFYAGKVFFGRRLTVNDSRDNIKRLVDNPDYMIREGAHSPLYPYSDYLAIMAEFERRQNLPTVARYPWSGLLHCSKCKKGLRRKEGRYVCLSCRKINIHDAELIALVPPAIQKSLRHLEPIPPESQSTSILPALNEYEKTRNRIKAAYEAGVYSLQEAEDKIKDIDSKVKKLKSTELAQARLEAERKQFLITFEYAQELLDDLPEWMLADEPKIVNSLLGRLFRCIQITPTGEVVPILRG